MSSDHPIEAEENTFVDGQQAAEAIGPELQAGDKIFRYIILEKIGQGGMGTVYKAYDPKLDRRIALKFVRVENKEEEDTSIGHSRLFREAQALAQLSHPNVVTVHDVGTYNEHLYMAMEFVEGQTLRNWIEAEHPSKREIIDTYVQAGQGLAAAHDVSLIHRDFKPDNVIVGAKGRVLVIDFGLARAAVSEQNPGPAMQRTDLESLSREHSLDVPITAHGRIVGTIRYLAPEQFLSEPVDARTDQFAFSVSLFESLFGHRPFAGQTFAELARNVIRGRLRTDVAKETLTEAWVYEVLKKGLATERELRYADMHALIRDLQRDPEKELEQRRAQRRRFGLIGLALVVSSAVAALGVWWGVREDQRCATGPSEFRAAWNPENRTALQQAFLGTLRPYAQETFRLVADKFDTFGESWVAMHKQACEATHFHGTQSQQMLDLRMRCLQKKKNKLKALIDVFIQHQDPDVLDKAVQASSDFRTVAFCADVAALSAARPPPEEPVIRSEVEAIAAQLDRVEALELAGKYKDALALAAVANERAQKTQYGPVQMESWYQLGINQDQTADYVASVASLERALGLAQTERDALFAARVLEKLLYIKGYRQQKFSDVSALQKLTEFALALGGGEIAIEAELLISLGDIHRLKSEIDEALGMYRRAQVLYERSLGKDHPKVGSVLNRIGQIYRLQGNTVASIREFERVLSILKTGLGSGHPHVGHVLNNLGSTLAQQGDYQRAREKFEQALALLENAYGSEHPYVATSLQNLSQLMVHLGQPKQAEAYIQRALAILQKILGPEHPEVAWMQFSRGSLVLSQGNIAEAERIFESVLARWTRAYGEVHPQVAVAQGALAGIYFERREDARARDLYERMLTVCEKAVCSGEYVSHIWNARFNLARILWRTNADRGKAKRMAQELYTELASDTDAAQGKLIKEVAAWLAHP